MQARIFRQEDAKYSALWSNGYKDANWERLAKAAVERVNGSSSLVDFGCGRGKAMDFFARRGMYCEGVEISSYLAGELRKDGKWVHHASLDNMPFRDNQFGIGFSNDVIEHVPEELVQPSLNEMARVCSDYLFLSVCPEPSHHLSKDGENLHLTVRPAGWWEAMLRKYGKVERINFWLSRSSRYAINLKS